MQNRFDVVIDTKGNTVPGVSITVNTSAGGLATVYSDNGVTPIANPLTSNALGEYSFYAANGTYSLAFSAVNFPGITVPGIVMYDPTDLYQTPPFVPNAAAGANWAQRDARFFVSSDKGLIQICGFVSTANAPNSPSESIAGGYFLINNKAGAKGWPLYSDIQHESGAGSSYGLEVAAKNKGSNLSDSPYVSAGGVYGVWLDAGGDASYGGSSANPSNAAIKILANSNTWNAGIVFDAAGITGSDGTTGVADAILFGKGQRMRWLMSGNFTGAQIRSDVSSGGTDVGILFSNNQVMLQGASGASMFGINWLANSVNRFTCTTAATGGTPSLGVTGTDPNIDFKFVTQGTGLLQTSYASTAAAIPANFTADRILAFKDSSGTTLYFSCRTTPW